MSAVATTILTKGVLFYVCRPACSRPALLRLYLVLVISRTSNMAMAERRDRSKYNWGVDPNGTTWANGRYSATVTKWLEQRNIMLDRSKQVWTEADGKDGVAARSGSWPRRFRRDCPRQSPQEIQCIGYVFACMCLFLCLCVRVRVRYCVCTCTTVG